MSKSLVVYLHQTLVGELIQDKGGQLLFKYSESWLGNPEAIPLSNSLPLQKEIFLQKECRAFFAGLLPEEFNRKLIAKNLGISAKNDFMMLEHIGGECAGAVSFFKVDDEVATVANSYQIISDKEFNNILTKLPRSPLMAGTEDIRLSLAGAQNKIAICLIENQIALPLNGAASTHIVKPANIEYEGLVQNEAFCMELAKAIKLPTASVKIGHSSETDYLLVKRYDRSSVSNFNKISDKRFEASIQRIHQEDFCQALNIVPEIKYQQEGEPSLKQCFNLIRSISTIPALDLQNLLDVVIFNFLIGNNDAHGKNFSLLYTQNLKTKGYSIKLAPFYDLVSTIYYPELSKKMAMKIGDNYVAEKIRLEDFEKLAMEVGLSKKIVLKRVNEISIKVLETLQKLLVSNPISSKLAEIIFKRCELTLIDFK